MGKYKSLMLLAVIAGLSWGFWQSEDFTQLASGLALFMFGMLALEQGFQAFSGGVLEAVLGAATRTRLRSLGFGMATTALMQSSSLVSLITISFLSSGLIGLAAGIGIIFGSNIGTTTGAWLMASYGVKIDLATYAMPLAVFGILLIYQKDKVLKGGGHVLLGIAFLFIGIQFIKLGFEALSEGMDLTQFAMDGVLGVLVYSAIGIALTVVMQSSHAVLMLTIAALATGQVSYYNALALAIGSNVGTTITAVIGAMGSNVAGRRLAGAHMVFNFTTGFIAIVAIQPLAAFVDVSADWLGIAQDDYTLKLAIFHTVFNLLGVVLMMPLIDRLVTFLERVLPDKIVVDGVEQPLFITDAVVDYPDAALVALTSETRHLAINAIEILTKALGLKFQDVLGDEPMKDVVARSRTVITMRMKELYRKKIKAIYGAILEFCVRAQPNMDGDQAERLYQLKTASHRIVETMKELRLLRRNMAEAIASPNEYVREQYDLMRIHLGEFLRATDRSSKEDDLAEISARYHALAQNALKDDPVANGTLDRLIRDRLITPEQGVSLTNDTSHVTHIYTWLMETAEIIFAATANLPVQPDETLEIEGNIGDPQKEVRRLLARSHDEIEERLRRIREGG